MSIGSEVNTPSPISACAQRMMTELSGSIASHALTSLEAPGYGSYGFGLAIAGKRIASNRPPAALAEAMTNSRRFSMANLPARAHRLLAGSIVESPRLLCNDSDP